MLDDKTTEQLSENTLEAQLHELTKENEMLLEQLHLVQEELEKYYYKLRDAQKNPSVVATSVDLSSFQALIKAYSSLRHSEIHNTLQYRIGDAVLGLKKSLFTAPIKLFLIFLFFIKSTPPKELGGKSFTKVIEAYSQGGKESVKTLLSSVKITSIVKANAYTALAKHLQKTDLISCIDFACTAYKTDPQAYRLKWWIFRLHDKGDYETASALAHLLPKNMPLKDSEKRKIEVLLQYSKHPTATSNKAINPNNNEALTNKISTLEKEKSSLLQEKSSLLRDKNFFEERCNEQVSLIKSKEEVVDLIKEKLSATEQQNIEQMKEIAKLQGALTQTEKLLQKSL